MRVVRRGHHPVFGLPDAAGGVLCLPNGSVYAAKVVGMNVAPRFFDRRGQQGVPMKPRYAHIAVELTGSKVRAECTKLGTIKGQMKALRALFECLFAPAPFGE